MNKARADYDNGEFRFAATVLNKLVFAQPDNKGAAELLAQTYTQLGYLAESGSWRNFYLTGAQELRGGIGDMPKLETGGADMVKAVPLDIYFDLLAVRLNGPKAAKKDMDINFVISDTGQKAHLFTSNGTLHNRMGQTKDGAPTINVTRGGLDLLNLKQKTFADLIKDGSASIDGNPLAVRSFFGLIEEPEFWFEIVRP
jgi:alkyl sulfatase BDS1-like metallo-beta-lactamase superfamily hydrolase